MHTWIFQSDEASFDFNTYLMTQDYVTWPVRQKHLAELLEVGDTVFIWRRTGNEQYKAGVVAIATVTKTIYEAEVLHEDMLAMAELQLIDVDPTPRVPRDVLATMKSFKELQILRMDQYTNYLISPVHAKLLQKMWDA